MALIHRRILRRQLIHPMAVATEVTTTPIQLPLIMAASAPMGLTELTLHRIPGIMGRIQAFMAGIADTGQL